MKKAIVSVGLALVIFGAIAAPLLVSMSTRVGRPSYSEAGNMNYVWHVNHFNPYLASASSSGPPSNLRHPMTLLHKSPDVFGFREPLDFTYPPRQDMEYWSAGVSTKISLDAQLRAIAENARVLFTDPHILPLWILIGGAVLVLISRNAGLHFWRILRTWPVIVPGIIAPCLYLLISVEPRYVAPFLVLVLLGLFPGILVRKQASGDKRGVILAIAAATLMTVLTCLLITYHLAGFPPEEGGGVWLAVGQSLNAAGVHHGEDVAIIGDSSDGCRWARMARVRIVAQILREDVGAFWQTANPHARAEVYDAFARFGAKAVIAEDMPPPEFLEGWRRLGNTHYFVRLLRTLE